LASRSLGHAQESLGILAHVLSARGRNYGDVCAERGGLGANKLLVRLHCGEREIYSFFAKSDKENLNKHFLKPCLKTVKRPRFTIALTVLSLTRDNAASIRANPEF
jgi:hypothetical protein